MTNLTTNWSRFSLNYKGLPYRTEWVEYADIESVSLKHNATPTGKRPDGSDRYTLPMIYDPNTKRTVSESAAIATYLDDTYPDTPALFPAGTRALQLALIDTVLYPQISIPIALNINPARIGLSARSLEFIESSILRVFGKTPAELGGEHHWVATETALGKVRGWLSANGPGRDTLFLGDVFSFVDFQLASVFMWAKVSYGEDSEEWKRITSWQGGAWKDYLGHFEKYMAVDNV